ncbi:MAG: hypothetical protein M1820_008399 [Bogoriella megaspora]|nr:MAG: hypothetical protein M1820_008399 [Bogoriella megaspora]
MAAHDVEARIAALEKEIQSLSKDTQDEVSRKKLSQVLEQNVRMLEPPVETIWKIIMSPHAPSALMVLIRLGAVKKVVEMGKPVTAKELSISCGGEEMLISESLHLMESNWSWVDLRLHAVRLMRPLVALGIFRETDIQTYEATPISKTLMAPPLIGGYQFMFDLPTRSLANMPRYLERTGFKNVSGAPGPFQDCNNTEDLMFSYLMKHPDMMSNFNDFMGGNLETRPDWHASFPVRDIILAGAKVNDPDSVLLVDIGGGEGHDIASFHRAFPNAPGKLVLQDLPPVIDNIKNLDPAIVRQKHDFFNPQPVRGARAYYLRYVFHDWPDADCLKIMRAIAAAMTPGYSKLLIFEWVLPAKGVPLYPALLDINMMAILNGMERTEAQWKALLAEAGLKIIKTYKTAEDAEGLIEAGLA